MSSSVSRRDFLKLAGLAPLGLALPGSMTRVIGPLQAGQRASVLIVVLDAFSAYNMSLYGYARQTTPNIDRLAKRAIVYHDQYAAGNFTNPGTASLLTGVYAWTHRAIRPRDRTIPRFHGRNLFTVFDDYHRFAYTHNPWAYAVLRPMAAHLEELPAVEDLYLEAPPGFIRTYLGGDDDIATVAWGLSTGFGFEGHAYSLLLSSVLTSLRDRGGMDAIRRQFPRGLPGHDELTSFIMETAIDWLIDEIKSVPQPFLGYVHLLPPHHPYRTRVDFIDRFLGDGLNPARKPIDLFATEPKRDEAGQRRYYDEYILYVDAEFNRLYAALEESGALQNTWLVLTSDHGEVFERGLREHATDTLYEPEIRVPLLIFEPGREEGMEIHTPTSAVDLLSTLARVTGHVLPPWHEGRVLPPYADETADPDRNVYSLMAAHNDPLAAIHNATAAVRRGNHKLQYYFGYSLLEGRELKKLYDVIADPEEMADLVMLHPEIAGQLLDDLKGHLVEADDPYVPK